MGNSAPLPASVATQLEQQRAAQTKDGSVVTNGGLILDISRQPDFKQYLEHSAADTISPDDLTSIPPANHVANVKSLRVDFHSIDALHSLAPLKTVTLLSFRFNRINRIAPDISALKNIIHLDLHNNRLVTLPNELFTLTKLVHLDVSCNQLTELPKVIGNLVALERLNVKSNSLMALPVELGRLPRLRSFIATINRCKQPPQSVCDAGSAPLLDRLHEMAHTTPSIVYHGRFSHIVKGHLPLVGERFGKSGSSGGRVSPRASLPSPTAAAGSQADPSALALGRVPVTSVPTAQHASAAAHAIIEQYFSDCDVAWCSGSLISGKGTATSDLDIVILYLSQPSKPFFRGMNNGAPPSLPYRASFQTPPNETSPETGWPVEVFVHTPESLRQYFEKDRVARKPSLSTMVNEGTIVWRSSDTTSNKIGSQPAEVINAAITSAVTDAKALIKAGPPPLTPSELVWARYNVTSLMDDVRGDITATGGEFAFACAALAQSIASLWLGFHRRWQGNGKWVYRSLRVADPILARQLAVGLDACFTMPNQAQLLDVAARVLSMTGGAAFDGLYADATGARMLAPTLSIDDGSYVPGSNQTSQVGSSDRESKNSDNTDAIAHSPLPAVTPPPTTTPPSLILPPSSPVVIAEPTAVIVSAPPSTTSTPNSAAPGTPTNSSAPPLLPRAPSTPPPASVIAAAAAAAATSSSSTTTVTTTSSSSSSGGAGSHPTPPKYSPTKLLFTSTSSASALFADRLAGCIFGAAIGDAIGVATEFMDRDEANFHYRIPLQYGDIVQDRHRIKFRRGHWTDDTYQGLVIMLSMLENKGNVVPLDIGQRLAKWADHGFPELGDNVGWGIGNTVGQVLQHSEFKHDPHKAANAVFVSSGRRLLSNGAVMRTGVVACMDALQPLDKLVGDTRSACQVTHAAPQCVASCIAVTAAIQGLLQGRFFPSSDSKSTTDTASQLSGIAHHAFATAVHAAFPGCPPEASATISSGAVSEAILPADSTATDTDLAQELWQYLAPTIVATPPTSAVSPLSAAAATSSAMSSTATPASSSSSSSSGGVTPATAAAAASIATSSASSSSSAPVVNWSNLSRLKLDDGRSIGYTYKATGAAFWALRSGLDFESAITALTLEAGDADTNATVAGALLGARVGYSGLPKPWVDGLVHKAYLTKLVQRVLEHNQRS